MPTTQTSAQRHTNEPHSLHMGIAEQGKLLALKHNHGEALRHYREAIRLAISIKAPEVFFRHYTQCVLESLELTGSYREVIEFCEKADNHYQTLDLSTQLVKKDWGSARERCGVNYWKAGDTALARERFEQALALSDQLPLAVELLGWLRRGLSADANRIVALQKKHRYFVVRTDQVNSNIAIPIEKLGAMASPIAL